MPPPAAPYGGGSYPPPDQGYGQGSSFGNQPPGAQAPSYGDAQGGYGASSYPPPPTPSFGQAPAWGGAPQTFGAGNPEAQSAKQMAIIALVVSCLAIPLDFCCYIGLFLGPLGAILGFVAKGKLSRNNADASTMYLRNLDTGEESAIDTIEGARYAYASWTPDDHGFYYVWLPTDPKIRSPSCPATPRCATTPSAPTRART